MAFTSKLLLFVRQMEKKQFTHFNALQQDLPSDCKINYYILQLRNFHADFSYRFDDFKMIESDLNLVSALSAFVVDERPENLQLEFIDLQSNKLFLDRFNEVSILEFYASLGDEKFSNLKNFAKKHLALFGSTHVCEPAFSIMKCNKSRLRSVMTDEHLSAVLTISTSALTLDFDSLVSAQQRSYSSH